MDRRGWGLSHESDHHHHLHHHHHSFLNMKPEVTNSSSNHHHNNQMFQGLGDRDRGRQLDLDDHGARKVPVGELDFFSHNRSSPCHVKQEDSFRDYRHHPAPVAPHPALKVNTGLHLLTTNTGSDQSTIDDGASSEVEDKRPKNQLAVLQAELKRMSVENQNLKNMLSQISISYKSLQANFADLMQQQKQQHLLKPENTQPNEVMQEMVEEKKSIVPRQFLDLGSNSNTEANELSDDRTLDRGSGSPQNKEGNNGSHEHMKGGDVKEDSHEDSEWVPNKAHKLSPPKANSSPIDQAATEATMRKARVSVKALSEAPMISDGCQWRKYGQKMAKGNPCPRAYYRCTMAVGCPVRKQVQRCAEDRSILITTYEGNHNHPLPPAAMAMASTTSAAASMLLSGSMPSGDGLMNPNFLARTILPCSSSMATISASAPFPTITLDLTHSPNPLQRPSHLSQQHQTPFHVPFTSPNGQVPSNFLASSPQIFGQVFNNNNNNQSTFSGLHTSSSQGLDAVHLQLPNQNAMLRDTLSAATAAVAADPNFTAALAAAISSLLSGIRPGENNIVTNNAPGNSPSGEASSSGHNVNSSSMPP